MYLMQPKYCCILFNKSNVWKINPLHVKSILLTDLGSLWTEHHKAGSMACSGDSDEVLYGAAFHLAMRCLL